MTTLNRTPERTASEAAWIAGLTRRYPDRLLSERMHWLADSSICDRCGYFGIERQEMTSLPTLEVFEALLHRHTNYGERIMIVADAATSFLLASELLDLTQTPTSTPTKMQEILGDEVFYDVPMTYVFGDRSSGGTTSCDWLVGLHELRPRAELRVVEPPPKPKSRAFAMFNELREWLNLTTQETATLVGVGRTTPLAWERDGREPRPAHARRLYQLHSIIGALVKRLGADAAIEWLERGEPSPWERLERGEVAQVARAAERILLHREPRSRLPERDAIVVEDQLEDGAASRVVPLRAARRRRRRRRREGGAA